MPRIIHIVRSVGPTSMPWNDLYYSARFMFPGSSHIPLQVDRIWGRGKFLWQKCNDREYRYINSSVVSAVCRVRKIYLNNQKTNTTSIVHIHNPSLFIVAALIKFFCPKIKVMVNLHNDWRFFKLSQKVGLHVLVLLADHVVTVSSAIKTSIPDVRAKTLIEENKLSAIPNGIRLSDFADYDVTGSRKRVMVIVARMVPQKNCFFAIDILVNSKSIEKLIWIGDGFQREAILRYAEKRGVDTKLDFKGVIDRQRVYEILSESSIYIAPSKWEGIGVANLEAAALGCIPLLSAIPPHQEIADNVKIETHSLEDADIWAREIDRLLDWPPGRVATCRLEVSRLVKEKYSLAGAVQNYINLYRKI